MPTAQTTARITHSLLLSPATAPARAPRRLYALLIEGDACDPTPVATPRRYPGVGGTGDLSRSTWRSRVSAIESSLEEPDMLLDVAEDPGARF
jgi:hypothetical protein